MYFIDHVVSGGDSLNYPNGNIISTKEILVTGNL